MKRAVIYARVSSEEQARRGLSIPEQVDCCRRYARDHDLDVVGQYVDEAESGMTDERPQFQRMIAAGCAGEYAHLICHKGDRFARDRVDAAVYKRDLRRRGIVLHFVTEPIVDGPDGALLEALTEAIADRFSHNLSAEVRKGLAAKRKRGDPHGTAPYGYRWAKPEELPRDRLTQLLPDKQEAPVLQMLFDWLEAGESYHGMVRRLNEMGIRARDGGPWAYHSTVKKMLTNPTYAGYLTMESKSYRPQVAKQKQERRARSDWQLMPSDRFEPLIERDRWARIQGLVAARSRKAAQAAPYLFSGIVACPFRGCKGHLIGATNHKRRGKPYYRYACNVEPRQHRCMTWPRDHLEARILEALEGVGDHPTAQVRFAPVPGSSPEVEAVILKASLQQIEQRAERAKDAYENGDYDLEEMKRRVAAHKADHERVSAQLAGLTSKPAGVGRKQASKVMRSLAEVARDENLSVRARRAILASHICAIELPGGRLFELPPEKASCRKLMELGNAVHAAARAGNNLLHFEPAGSPVGVSLDDGCLGLERRPDRIAGIWLYQPKVVPLEPARGIEPPTR